MYNTKVSHQVSVKKHYYGAEQIRNGAEQLSNFSELTFDRGGSSAVCGLTDLSSMFHTPISHFQTKNDVKLLYKL